MKRLITILVVSVLSVISTNSSAVAGDACDACKWKVQYIQAHEGEFSCSSLQTNDIVQGQCALQIYGSDNCAQTSSWVVCNQVLDNNRDEAWCDDQDVCGGSGGGSGGEGGGSSNTCPSDCTRPSVTYQELGNDIVKVSTRYCDASTNYVCRTKTENITLLTEKQFDTATVDCVTGNCIEWDCVWTEGVGTTCRAGGNNQPFCMCALYNGNYLKTVAVRLGCNSTTNTGYNCNGISSADDMDGSSLYCDLTASTNAGAGVCRYKKTCSTDCNGAWGAISTNPRKAYLYRLKGECDYTTGSCVPNGGTVASDFDYKCDRDKKGYETGTVTCTGVKSGKPSISTCKGCTVCSTTNTFWKTTSNPAYQQLYHNDYKPISGTDRYQCAEVGDSQYLCNSGWYGLGTPATTMTGCNACPTLASSGLTIVNDGNQEYVGIGSDKLATTIYGCDAHTGIIDQNGRLNDGMGTFFWDTDALEGKCKYQ